MKIFDSSFISSEITSEGKKQMKERTKGNGSAGNGEMQGCSPLWIASYKGHTSVCDVLLSHGAQVNQAQYPFPEDYFVSAWG
jgi:hypothetical protein